MKYFVRILAGISFVFAFSNAFAQNNVGPLVLDPAFANSGKSEIDFEGANDDATCFVVSKPMPGGLNRILVGGKIHTSTPGEIHFGMIEYDTDGVPESSFGIKGKAELSWDSDDYPTAISLLPNRSILAAGASAADKGHIIPTIFRLKANGTPDSSFGPNGRIQVNSLSNPFMGEFENLDTFQMELSPGNLSFRGVAMGIEYSSFPKDPNVFYAIRFDSTGTLDTSFGVKGQATSKAPVSSSQGHLIAGGGVMFVGLSDTGKSPYPEILLCKLQPNGTPDSSFGTNGVLNTGIALHGGNRLLSLYDPDSPKSDPYKGLIISVPLEDSSAMLPFTLIKFKLDGTLDSNFGMNGYATAPIISNMPPHGMTLSNDGSVLMAGAVGTVSAAAKFFPNGLIDTTFGSNGVAMLDADAGLHQNYLIGFVPASLFILGPHKQGAGQRFVGVGTSINAAGNDDFLVARYMPASAGASFSTNASHSTMELYPNPTRRFVNVEIPDGTIERISIVDALGRIVQSFERPQYAASSNSYYLDVSAIPNGAYSCTIRTTGGIFTEQFTVIH
jgi:uncharacterized delta-60 repeat protein